MSKIFKLAKDIIVNYIHDCELFKMLNMSSDYFKRIHSLYTIVCHQKLVYMCFIIKHFRKFCLIFVNEY